MPTVVEHQKRPRQAAVAAWVGSALEYYDFFVYGTVAALVFPAVFFDQSNPTTATLASLASFGVAYIARPVGSFLMGHIGDKVGRKTVMVGTLLLMGLSTFLIGCLPTYSSIGIWAPVLLVLLRVLQGLSASGEQAGAISMSFEHAPDDRRGYYTSWTLSGTFGGQVIAPAVVLPLSALLTDEQLQTWGWRIPFLLSAVVVLVGYLIRRSLEETPAFQAEADEGTVPTVPVEILFRTHWRGVVRVFFAAFLAAVGTLFSVFGLAFATGSVYGVGVSQTSMLWLAIVSNVIAVLTIPMFAALSDRVGRKQIYVYGSLGCAVSLSLFFWSITTGSILLIFTTGVLFNSVFYAMTNAVWPATYAEIFPTRVRLSGMAIGTQIGYAIGGFAPTAAAAIAGDGPGGWVPVAIYVLAASLTAAIAVATARETYKLRLADIDRRTEAEPRRAPAAARPRQPRRGVAAPSR
jgi:MFS family permease